MGRHGEEGAEQPRGRGDRRSADDADPYADPSADPYADPYARRELADDGRGGPAGPPPYETPYEAEYGRRRSPYEADGPVYDVAGSGGETEASPFGTERPAYEAEGPVYDVAGSGGETEASPFGTERPAYEAEGSPYGQERPPYDSERSSFASGRSRYESPYGASQESPYEAAGSPYGDDDQLRGEGARPGAGGSRRDPGGASPAGPGEPWEPWVPRPSAEWPAEGGGSAAGDTSRDEVGWPRWPLTDAEPPEPELPHTAAWQTPEPYGGQRVWPPGSGASREGRTEGFESPVGGTRQMDRTGLHETGPGDEGGGPAGRGRRSGFLGSGWTADGDPDADAKDDPKPGARGGRRREDVVEDDWDEPRSRGAGRFRPVLLAVAAVVVVLGGTVAGIKMLGGTTTAADGDCPAGQTCAAVATNRPTPDTSSTESSEELFESEEPPPVEETEAAEDDPATPTPSGRATAAPPPVRPTTAPRTSRSPSPRPTPTSRPTRSPVQVRGEPTEEPEESPSLGNVVIEPPRDTSPPGTPFTTPTSGSGGDQPLSSGGMVSMGFDVVSQGRDRYVAELSVVNESTQTLPRFALRVPVAGRVLDVTGHDWSQEGDTLLIEAEEGLLGGDGLVVTFTARGRAATPATCELPGGACTLA
jgi:hypothetical protein